MRDLESHELEQVYGAGCRGGRRWKKRGKGHGGSSSGGKGGSSSGGKGGSSSGGGKGGSSS